MADDPVFDADTMNRFRKFQRAKANERLQGFARGFTPMQGAMPDLGMTAREKMDKRQDVAGKLGQMEQYYYARDLAARRGALADEYQAMANQIASFLQVRQQDISASNMRAAKRLQAAFEDLGRQQRQESRVLEQRDFGPMLPPTQTERTGSPRESAAERESRHQAQGLNMTIKRVEAAKQRGDITAAMNIIAEDKDSVMGFRQDEDGNYVNIPATVEQEGVKDAQGNPVVGVNPEAVSAVDRYLADKRTSLESTPYVQAKVAEDPTFDVATASAGADNLDVASARMTGQGGSDFSKALHAGSAMNAYGTDPSQAGKEAEQRRMLAQAELENAKLTGQDPETIYALTNKVLALQREEEIASNLMKGLDARGDFLKASSENQDELLEEAMVIAGQIGANIPELRPLLSEMNALQDRHKKIAEGRDPFYEQDPAMRSLYGDKVQAKGDAGAQMYKVLDAVEKYPDNPAIIDVMTQMRNSTGYQNYLKAHAIDDDSDSAFRGFIRATRRKARMKNIQNRQAIKAQERDGTFEANVEKMKAAQEKPFVPEAPTPKPPEDTQT